MRDSLTFGCPVYALGYVLASGKSLPMWSPRARQGINGGPMPGHAHTVKLVLNSETLLYSSNVDTNIFFEQTALIRLIQ